LPHLKRYWEPNTEVRRIPIAFAVVVDQAHINDVLTATSNSRLRIQITQAVWGHYGAISGGSSSDNTGVAAHDEASLVGLAVYGWAVIYEDPEAWKRIESGKPPPKVEELAPVDGETPPETPPPDGTVPTPMP
jgi:hypothetical protein